MQGEKTRSTHTLSHAAAYALLVATMALWSSGLVAARAVHELIPPLALTFWRWVAASVILFPFVWRELPRLGPFIRAHWPGLLRLTVFMVAGAALSVVAVNFTTATNATLINATQPALTAVVAWLIAQERLLAHQGFGIGLAFLGIVVMVSKASLQALIGLDINVGDLVMLVAVLGWALYAVHLQREGYELSGIALLFLIACTGAAIALPLYLAEALVTGRWGSLDPRAAAAVLYLGGGATVLAVYLWNRCIGSVGANRAAIFINLMPVFGAGLAMVFLNERLAAYHVAGAVLVCTGILLSVRRRPSRAVIRSPR